MAIIVNHRPTDFSQEIRMSNKFRELVRGGEFAAGLMCFLPSEAIVDLLGYAGFDYVMFDQEHAPYDVLTIESLVRAAEAVGLPSIARLPGGDASLIARTLDTGVDGLMFGRVDGAEAARELVSLCRLAPEGNRGACPGARAGRYFLIEKGEYTRRANDVAVVIMIETKRAYEEIEEILAIPGVDAVVVGPTDLSYSMGIPREDPRILEAQQRVLKLARAAGVGVMQLVKKPEDTVPWLEMEDGPRVFWYTTDGYQIGVWFDTLVKESRELVAQHTSK
jgi:4-hydroxy-2-oxoheptanedioate aldolase